MPTTSRDSIADLLFAAAAELGATVEPLAQQLVGPKFNSEVLSEVATKLSMNSQGGALPPSVTAAKLDGIPVLMGELSGAPIRGSVEPQLRRYRNQALIARSWLGSEAPNLQLFLAGPVGALSDSKWRQLAAEIEADDRTCRKLVWLFESAPSVREAQGFLERTFIASPWPTESQRVKLDVVADYSLPKGWEEALDDASLDNDGLVERLILLEREVTP